MAYKSNLDKHTVSWLKSQDDKGRLNKNISIQRKEVWDLEKKSNLIISLLLDIPVESLLFEETDGDALNVLDGKQRTLTLCAFLDDKFALSPKTRVKEIDGSHLVGATFSALPEALQGKIKEYELSISIMRPLDAEGRAMVFFMRNQAVSLSKMDLSLVMLGEEATNTLDALCNHNFMLQKIKMTEPARRKHTDLQVILQYLILSQRPDMGFSGAEIMGYCDDIKNGEAEIPSAKLSALLDYLDAAVPEKRQYLKKAHIPGVFHAAQAAMDMGMRSFVFGARLDEFFADLEDKPEYMATYGAGSSKRGNVQARVRILGGILDGYEVEAKAEQADIAPEEKTDAPAVGGKKRSGKSGKK